jgi:predicted dehydrogenase
VNESVWTALEYRPPAPHSDLGIGMVGCGGIAGVAARAYRSAGYRVVAVCDVDRTAAERIRDESLPDARVVADYRELLELPGIDVVDIATHTAVRPPLVRDSLLAGKHVQSQKPFVDDLRLGEELCDLADAQGVLLSVNQNGRWAPHFAYLLSAVRAGLLGEISSADFAAYWDHDSAVAGSRFAEMNDLVLMDFGIHWFDLVGAIFAGKIPLSVTGKTARSPLQTIPANTLAAALIDYGDAQSSLLFRAASRVGEEGTFRVDGTLATIRSRGAALGGPDIVVSSPDGELTITLEGEWMPNALAGTMGDLLGAISSGRRPDTDARRVLDGLRLCFAAIASARAGGPVDPRAMEHARP